MTPTVTGLVGTAAGSITGNTTVTIQGTGFWNAPNGQFPAQVFFCPTGGGSCLSGSCREHLAAAIGVDARHHDCALTPP